MLPTNHPHKNERYTETQSKGMQKNTSCKWKGKNSGVARPMYEKRDIKRKVIVRDKEGR